MKTYSLADVAAAHGLHEVSKDPVRWLSMRLNRGELRGIRFGRYWRMSEADVQFMLDKYHNGATGEPPKPAAAELASAVDGIARRGTTRQAQRMTMFIFQRRRLGSHDGHSRANRRTSARGNTTRPPIIFGTISPARIKDSSRSCEIPPNTRQVVFLSINSGSIETSISGAPHHSHCPFRG
ncbi:hypothetical protein [Mycobacterium simiae]|uniref:hypothetical protein n=1 Tax=Mycobacterium simiae TaxID=1784 RepID=UPI00165ED73F|nr:hypothetical protein [Mycobacterium simiae]